MDDSHPLDDSYTLRYGSSITEEEFRRYALRKKMQAEPGSTLQTMTIDDIWSQVEEHAVRQRDWSPFLRELQNVEEDELQLQQSEAENRENVPPLQASTSQGSSLFPTPPPFGGGAKAAPTGCEDSPSSFSSQLHAVLELLPKAPSSPFSSPAFTSGATKDPAPAPPPVIATPVLADTESSAGTPVGWPVGAMTGPVVGRLVDEVSPLSECKARCDRARQLVASSAADAEVLPQHRLLTKHELEQVALDGLHTTHACQKAKTSKTIKVPSTYAVQRASPPLPPWFANAVRCFLCLPRDEPL